MMISGILSRREVEILELVSSGLSNQDIAMRLGITKSTNQPGILWTGDLTDG